MFLFMPFEKVFGIAGIRMLNFVKPKLAKCSLKFAGLSLVCWLGRSGFNWCFLSQPMDLQVSQCVVSGDSLSLIHHWPCS